MLICDGLSQSGSELIPHSVLLFWRKEMERCKQNWFHCVDKIPLEWYSAIVGQPSSALLAAQCSDIPADTKQCWVASPYHAQPGHNSVRVTPEGQFPWMPEDASQLCKTINPLLADEGMQLMAVGAALLLTCREPLQAYPSGFGEISGKILPDRSIEGRDGGRLSRLLSEIQMFLFQHPLAERRNRGEPEVNGIWLWGAAEWPQAHKNRIAVATRNPFLQSIVAGRDAKLMITEADRLGDLMSQGAPLPKRVVLAGEGYAVILSKSLLLKFGKTLWKPKSTKPESELLSLLHTLIACCNRSYMSYKTYDQHAL